jgi:hypothetical protein
MGYSHSFFALDVDRLKGIFASNNEQLLNEILTAQAEDIASNDAFFANKIKAGDLPSTATAIRQIFEGNPRVDIQDALYGYSLQIICRHMGEEVWGGEYGVANVSDHPYDSKLLKSGVPIPIPVPSDFPMIGYLSLNEIDDEIALATAEHAKPSNDSSEDIDAEEIQEDIDAYVETLQKAKDLGLGIVSFRH